MKYKQKGCVNSRLYNLSDSYEVLCLVRQRKENLLISVSFLCIIDEEYCITLIAISVSPFSCVKLTL